jgi:hypothetical protein
MPRDERYDLKSASAYATTNHDNAAELRITLRHSFDRGIVYVRFHSWPCPAVQGATG